MRRRGPGLPPRGLLVLGAATLVVAGLALGWLLRDTLDQPVALPPGFPATNAWPTATPTPVVAAALPRPNSDLATPAPAPAIAALDDVLSPAPLDPAPLPARSASRRFGRSAASADLPRAGLPARRQPRADTGAAIDPPVEAATASAVASGQGRLRVSSERPAQLFVDDEAAGNAPARLALPPGIHRVRLVYEDQSSSPVQWVAIEAGQEAQVSF